MVCCNKELKCKLPVSLLLQNEEAEMTMNKTPEGLKEKSKEIFDMERKLDKLYEQRREIINFLGLNKKPQE